MWRILLINVAILGSRVVGDVWVMMRNLQENTNVFLIMNMLAVVRQLPLFYMCPPALLFYIKQKAEGTHHMCLLSLELSKL